MGERTLDLGPAEDFPPGQRRIVEVDGRSIGVFNIEGTYHALRNRCPHMGAPVCLGSLGGTYTPSRPAELHYGLEGRVLRCPWHQWEFDVTTGRALFGVTPRRIPRYPVGVVEGRVVLSLRGGSAGAP